MKFIRPIAFIAGLFAMLHLVGCGGDTDTSPEDEPASNSTNTSNGTSTSNGTTSTSNGTTTGGASCGDGICASNEGCEFCPEDCACTTAGQLGEACYPNGTCDAGLNCEDDVCVELCGVADETCCEGDVCEGELVCEEGRCAVSCGTFGQACCNNETPCDAGLACQSGLCQDNTGQADGPCYPNATCNPGLLCEAEQCVPTCEGNAPLADLTEGVCASQVKVCEGTTWIEPDYTAIADYQAEEATCDSLDNDCDGDTDEMGPDGEPCDCNPAIEPTRPCGNDEGACQEGVQFCEENGEWDTSCIGEITQTTEVCNGLDDDCNGSMDDGLEPPIASLTAGVCQGQLKQCDGAEGWRDPDFTAIDNYQAVETTCDGIDNDCDGQIDEMGPDGPCDCNPVTDSSRPCGINIGECQKGQQTCLENGQWSDICEGSIDSTDEQCDGLDNDCNGEIDDGLEPPPASMTAGVCEGRLKRCAGPGGWLDPDPREIARYQEVETTCDGLDNDCDGQTDEDLIPPLADLQNGVCQGAMQVCSSDGLVPCSPSETETFGSCAQSNCGDVSADDLASCVLEFCNEEFFNLSGACGDCALANVGSPLNTILAVCSEAQSGWAEPDYSAINSYVSVEEGVCDDVDNDCNGIVDDGCVCTPGDREPCGSDVGACQLGEVVCDDQGQWGSCTNDIEAVDEVCNGIDDDCDGQPDDGFDIGGACDVVGLFGVCRDGVRACSGGAATCVQTNDPSNEVCNGLDDDCNNIVDDEGPWPAADSFEPNDYPAIVPLQSGDNLVTRFNIDDDLYHADANFDRGGDIDHYYSRSISLIRPSFLCRFTMDPQMRVNINVGFWSNSSTTLRVNESESGLSTGEVFVMVTPPIWPGPYRVDVVVVPTNSISGCFSDYLLECKFSNTGQW